MANKYTEAQAKATKKYLASRAEVKLWMLPVIKENIKASAEKAGKSINEYILDATARQMAEDQDGENVPGFVLSGAIKWLRDHGHTEEEITDFIISINREGTQ